jgi:hypothetical protein
MGRKTPAKNLRESIHKYGRGGYESPWSDDDCVAPRPTSVTPGTKQKREVLAQRLEAGESLWSEGDAMTVGEEYHALERWIDADLERDKRRRVYRLRQPVLVRVDELKLFGRNVTDWGAYFFLDMIAVVGSAVSIHLRDRDEWAAIDVVASPLESKEMNTLLAAIRGDESVVEEVHGDG